MTATDQFVLWFVLVLLCGLHRWLLVVRARAREEVVVGINEGGGNYVMRFPQARVRAR